MKKLRLREKIRKNFRGDPAYNTFPQLIYFLDCTQKKLDPPFIIFCRVVRCDDQLSLQN